MYNSQKNCVFCHLVYRYSYVMNVYTSSGYNTLQDVMSYKQDKKRNFEFIYMGHICFGRTLLTGNY